MKQRREITLGGGYHFKQVVGEASLRSHLGKVLTRMAMASSIWRNIPGRMNSECKNPEAGP